MEKQKVNKCWKEILGQPTGIIFSDLDGVWFDTANNFSGPSPKNLTSLKKAQNEGYLIVLVSDTAAKGLFNYAFELGIKSPIVISEGGLCIQSINGNKEILVDPRVETDIQKLRNNFTKWCQISGAEYYTGDATSFIRNNQIESSVNIKNNYPFYAINSARDYSFGVYTRKLNNKKLIIDNNLSISTYITLSQMYKDFPRLKETQYPEIGSCLVRPYPRPDKATSVQRLLDLTNYQKPCYMIGNEIADSMKKLNGRVITCAVGDADTELKTQADFIAPDEFNIASGANYIIKKIINKNI